jgi:hypothetical protein
MRVPPPNRKPWPMKWVVVAIFVIIVPYTFLTLRYRKPNRAFEPYADLKDRVNTTRLLSAGYQRLTIAAQRPADPVRTNGAAPTSLAAGGVPAALRSALVDPPLLPAEILSVSAAGTTAADKAYAIQFSCALPDDKHQLAGAQFYLRSGEMVVVPHFERVTGELQARSRENVVLLTIPAGVLKPGGYQATLLGQRASKTWTVQVH